MQSEGFKMEQKPELKGSSNKHFKRIPLNV
jgi:hypothetical protein